MHTRHGGRRQTALIAACAPSLRPAAHRPHRASHLHRRPACAAVNGVVLATEKKVPSILVEEDSMEKIAVYTGNIGESHARWAGGGGRRVPRPPTPPCRLTTQPPRPRCPRNHPPTLQGSSTRAWAQTSGCLCGRAKRRPRRTTCSTGRASPSWSWCARWAPSCRSSRRAAACGPLACRCSSPGACACVVWAQCACRPRAAQWHAPARTAALALPAIATRRHPPP